MTAPPRPTTAAVALDPLVVARAQSGDRQALDTVLRAIQAPLYAHARAILRDADAAADALQDALLVIARRLPTLRDPRLARAWAYRVTTREAVRRARRDRRRTALDDADTIAVDGATTGIDPAPEPPFEPELIARLPALLDALPPASGLVVRLHYLDELALAEIAESLDLPLGTVKSRLAYGLAALRRAVR